MRGSLTCAMSRCVILLTIIMCTGYVQPYMRDSLVKAQADPIREKQEPMSLLKTLMTSFYADRLREMKEAERNIQAKMERLNSQRRRSNFLNKREALICMVHVITCFKKRGYKQAYQSEYDLII